MTLIIAIILLVLAVVCYSISQLQQHGKLKWMDKGFGFWGAQSWYRKYKQKKTDRDPYDFEPAPNNWYYKLITVKFRERWFTSTWLTVNLTDGYHLTQSLSFLCLAGSLSMFSGYSFFIFWIGIVGLHATFYRIFSK